MTHTVDIVIAGAGAAAIDAAIDAVRRGWRVVIVMRESRPSASRRVRRWVSTAKPLRRPSRLIVVSGADVACVDGVNGIEAVIVRRRRTGRLIAFNVSALLDLGDR